MLTLKVWRQGTPTSHELDADYDFATVEAYVQANFARRTTMTLALKSGQLQSITLDDAQRVQLLCL